MVCKYDVVQHYFDFTVVQSYALSHAAGTVHPYHRHRCTSNIWHIEYPYRTKLLCAIHEGGQA